MRDLDYLRAEIDRVDRQILDLYEQRMELCLDVGRYKKAKNLPVVNLEREKEVVDQKLELLKNQGNRAGIVALYELLMDQSRNAQSLLLEEQSQNESYLAFKKAMAGIQQPMIDPDVVYQGEPGAYGEEAAILFFGEDAKRRNVEGFEDVFLAINEGRANYGVVPIENNSTGSINQVYDLLGKYGCYIVGQQMVQVEHALMAPEGADIDTIEEIYSHEQGFLQCGGYLKIHPRWKQMIQLNTAASAKKVADSGDIKKAAIASKRAAELYGLKILAEKINSNGNNFTRFVIVSKAMEIRPGSNKISAMFTIPHVEGSLYRMLGVFTRNGLNLLKLESRPIPDKSWEYNFFADFSGNLEDESVDRAIGQLTGESVSFRVLGNYVAGEHL